MTAILCPASLCRVSLKELRYDQNLVISKADKGNTTVVTKPTMTSDCLLC